MQLLQYDVPTTKGFLPEVFNLHSELYESNVNFIWFDSLKLQLTVI